MKVDLKNGRAVVIPATGKDFDPTRIPKAIRDAGFSPGEIELTAVGVVTKEGERLAVELSGGPAKLVLSGGAKLSELERRNELLGHRVRVTGKLLVSAEMKHPGLSVENWEEVRSP